MGELCYFLNPSQFDEADEDEPMEWCLFEEFETTAEIDSADSKTASNLECWLATAIEFVEGAVDTEEVLMQDVLAMQGIDEQRAALFLLFLEGLQQAHLDPFMAEPPLPPIIEGRAWWGNLDSDPLIQGLPWKWDIDCDCDVHRERGLSWALVQV